MADFHVKTVDGIATLVWDQPGRPINVMTLQGLDDLGGLFDEAMADPAVKAVVITSGKADFAAGMDINEIARLKSAGGDAPEEGLRNAFGAMHRLLRRIETAPKPVVAAVPGTALGIGFELALACHTIVAADAPKAKIGLPEIGLGIFPGAGGSARVTSLLGLRAAAPWLIDGRLTDPRGAQDAGLIAHLTSREDLQSEARRLALAGGLAPKPWDLSPPQKPAAPDAEFEARAAAARLRPMGRAPATAALLSVMRAATESFAAGIEAETREMARILMQPATDATLRTAFLSKAALERGARRPDLPASTLSRVGIIGAGMMGAGIAHVSALAGLSVTLIDASDEAAARGKSRSARLLENEVSKGRMNAAKMEATLALITPASGYAGLSECDLVIEAVFEDPAVKADVLAKAAAAMKPGAVLASNTSSLPISGLARHVSVASDFIGIHFFSPVDRMALVEIIRGPQTSDAATALAFDFTRRIRKTPIIVNDARYFYANRCIVPYLNECLRMVGEGIPPSRVEEACRSLGMPVGGLQLMDETSLDLGLAIARASKAALGEAYPHDAADAVLEKMTAEDRLGRKNGKGFYDYDAAGKRLGLWSGVDSLWPAANPQPEAAELEDRLLLVQIQEALNALQEGVLSDVREGDVAAVLGWGFAPWTGGPFGWVEIEGAAAAVARFEALKARHGPRFAPPAILQDMAARGESFYPAA